LGHHDGTLAEALRVLRQGGLILVEPGGGFSTLQTEKARFEKQGVEIQVAATFTEKLVFPDCYEFFRHYCVNWCTYDATRALQVTDKAAIDKVLAEATDANGSLFFSWSRILIGGRKTGAQPDAAGDGGDTWFLDVCRFATGLGWSDVFGKHPPQLNLGR